MKHFLIILSLFFLSCNTENPVSTVKTEQSNSSIHVVPAGQSLFSVNADIDMDNPPVIVVYEIRNYGLQPVTSWFLTENSINLRGRETEQRKYILKILK